MELMSELMKLARNAASDEVADVNALARRVVKQLSTARLRDLAVAEVKGWIDHFRREAARKIEEDARERKIQRDLELSTERDLKAKEDYDQVLSGPVTKENFLIMLDPTRPGNAKDRRWFRKRLGERFDDWYGLAHDYVQEIGYQVDFFESDWYIDGPTEYYANKRYDAMTCMIKTVEKETRLKVTEELLCSVFALGDGRTVSWRTATIADHEQRLIMLTKNAVGIIETAAMHQAAIEILKSSGIDRLGDLPT